jgi:hypothetical protein
MLSDSIYCSFAVARLPYARVLFPWLLNGAYQALVERYRLSLTSGKAETQANTAGR